MLNSVFEACRVFSIVSLVVGVLAILLFCMIPDRFRNKLIFATWVSGVRIFIRLTILLIVICNIISFLVFLGVTQGFKEAANNNCPHGPCRRFADSVRSEAGSVSTSNEWGPSTGWFVTLVNIVLAVATLLFVVTTKTLCLWILRPPLARLCKCA